MKIFYTTSDFTYKGNAYPGIPFLCDDDMEIIEVATNYLFWLAMENTFTPSHATWKSHAETLYDYFSWLYVNKLAWDDIPQKNSHTEEISNIASYRNWSADLINPKTGNHQIALSTIRKRLTQIMSFYRWALSRKRIPTLPWDQYFRIVKDNNVHPTMYRHTHAHHQFIKDNLRPKIQRKAIPLLRLEQCRELLSACNTQSLRLMVKLMLQTGLRNEECRTFPRKYIFDPTAQEQNRRIPIELSPQDMSLKGRKPRRTYISWQLMKDLFDYLNFGEGAQRAKYYRQLYNAPSPLTFLNFQGYPWSEKGLNNAFRKLWVPGKSKAPHLSFHVTPHMLRHTFATLELYAESRRRNLGAALAWVQDRMGHSSLRTTTIYIHCLDLMGEQDLNMYQREIDSILIED